jgi:hypothetical protein
MSNKITKDKNVIMAEIRQLISEGKTVSITAKGYSMNPFIRHMQDNITIGPWNDRDLKRGTAALVLTTAGEYVFHRIVKREGNMLVLEGDGNLCYKEKATIDNVVGIMHNITRNGRVYTPDSFCWKAYSWIWMTLRPVRRYPLGLWRRLVRQQPLK